MIFAHVIATAVSVNAADVRRQSGTTAPAVPTTAVANLFFVQINHQLSNSKVGYVDATGRMIIEPRFRVAWQFGSDGLAQVYHGSQTERLVAGTPAVINRRGEVIAESAYTLGYGRIAIMEGEHLRFTSLDNSFTSDIQCARVSPPFSEGLLAVQVNGKWGFIDESGKLAIFPKYDWVDPFSEGLAVAMVGDKCGYIDHKGRWAIEPVFESASPFSDELARVWIKDRMQYIDHSGRPAFHCDYEYGHSFTEGLAVVRRAGVEGYIDTSGKYQIKPQFRWAGNFREGLAFVQLPDRSNGYINRTGAMVIKLPSGVTAADDFWNGRAFIWHKDRQGLIDRSGNWVWSTTKTE